MPISFLFSTQPDLIIGCLYLIFLPHSSHCPPGDSDDVIADQAPLDPASNALYVWEDWMELYLRHQASSDRIPMSPE